MKRLITRASAVIALAAIFTTQSFAGGSNMEEHAILDTIGTMTTAFAAGDIETVMETYESGAVVVAQPGETAAGTAELRAMFAEFAAAGITFTYGAHEVVIAGDIGLHLMKWTAPGPDSDQSALSVAVLRRQPDGAWKMVIDHPFGDGVMASNR